MEQHTAHHGIFQLNGDRVLPMQSNHPGAYEPRVLEEELEQRMEMVKQRYRDKEITLEDSRELMRRLMFKKVHFDRSPDYMAAWARVQREKNKKDAYILSQLELVFSDPALIDYVMSKSRGIDVPLPE